MTLAEVLEELERSQVIDAWVKRMIVERIMQYRAQHTEAPLRPPWDWARDT